METEGTASGTSGTGGGQTMVPNQLAILVPNFDPSRDDLRMYTQKVELLVSAWPRDKISELVTRLILGCAGSAFQKLQLQKDQLQENHPKSVAKLIEILGGHWGQIPLEKKYESAERALYHCLQKQDESNDSYLARADILWTELISKQIRLEELQAYIVLRGSGLASEDKKRVVVESNLSGATELTMAKVSQAIRMLGAGFFHDVTGQRRSKTKVYEPETAFQVEDEQTGAEIGEAAFNVMDDAPSEGELIETLIAEGDEDAIYIADFEQAAGDVLQSDQELASCYNTYLEARKKLAEKARHRGFWPSSSHHSKGRSKGRGFSHGKGKGSRFSGKGQINKKSLQYRIMNSTCRRCHQPGHWKAECPLNQSSGPPSSSASVNSTVVSHQVPSSTHTSQPSQADVHQVDSLPLEFLNLDAVHLSSLDEPRQHIGNFCLTNWVITSEQGRESHSDKPIQDNIRAHVRNTRQQHDPNMSHPRSEAVRDQPPTGGHISEVLSVTGSSLDVILSTETCSRGSCGVLDSGATKTVVGSQHVAGLIAGFDEDIRSQLKQSTCNITFRFGNQGTLDARQSLVVPLGSLLLQIAIVPGATPFLVSNSLLRALKCTVDTQHQEIRSPLLKAAVPLELTSRGLFLIDMNKVAKACTIRLKTCVATYHHDDTKHVSLSCANHNQNIIDEQLVAISDSKHPGNAVETCPIPSSRLDHVGSQCPSSSSSCPRSNGSSRTASHDTGRTIHGEDQVRNNPQGQDICSSVERSPEVGSLDDRSLLTVPQTRSPQVFRVCREEDSRSRGPWRDHSTHGSWGKHGSGGHWISEESEEHPATQEPGQDEESSGTSYASASGCGSRVGGRVMVGSGTTRIDEDGRDCHHRHGSRCGRSPDTDVESRDDAAAGCESSESAEMIRDKCYLCNDLAGDFDQEGSFDLFTTETTSKDAGPLNHERRRMNYLIQKYTSELEDVCSKYHPETKPFDVFEVFCGPNSQITHQCQRREGLAMRFGLPEDLQTREGRHHLFEHLVKKEPHHLWFSPVCKPWSAWSQLNGHRSQSAWEDLVEQRSQHLEQVALGIVLFRYQRSKGRHMHWEQPLRSLMLKLPYMSEIMSQTRMAEFDMCEVGDLRDPISNLPIKKGMVVITTSPKVFENLHGRKCTGNHVHQQLEGSTRYHGQMVNRTQFSENYPRKFARLMSQLMCNHQLFRNEPFYLRSNPPDLVNAVVSDQSSGRLIKRPRMSLTARATLKKPSISSPPDVPVPKRQKLITKQSVPIQKEVWEKVFQEVNEMVPRVGKRNINSPEVISAIQSIWEDKEIQFIVACRGTDRALGPNRNVTPGEAPYRRCAFIHRSTGSIHTEDHWERWDNLSQRQICRNNHPCRLNITVFARNLCDNQQQVTSRAIESSESQSPGVSSQDHDTPQHEKCADNTVPETLQPSTIDEGSVKHGPKFMALPTEERQLMLKIHRNLGHPTSERLMHLLRQQGFRSECVQAVPDMKCSFCEMTTRPKCSRPATIKDPLDFNDKIAVDCIKWTNQAGNAFHIMHIIDIGTSYHVACVAPSRQTTQAIQNITNSWFQWAGAPGEMIVDSATELNSEEFMGFLQRNNIKCTTVVPDGHWQNGRSERHGAIMESMLSKYDLEAPINSYDELQQALWFIMQAKNASSLRRGFAPEVLVFGKHTRLPGSITSDENISAHCLCDAETAQGLAFRRQMELREIARRAFWHADNQAAIRRAMLRRTRPARKMYETGEWVMAWRSTPMPGQWVGPMRVVAQEGPHTVWITMSGKLYRVAPENIRDVSAYESRKIPTKESALPIPQGGITQFQELMNQGQRSSTTLPEHQSIPSSSNNPPISPEHHEVINPEEPSHPISSVPSDQPDGEPEASESPVPTTPSGTEVPIPVSDDDSLHCVGLHCHDVESPVYHTCSDDKTPVWHTEIYITDQDISAWREESDPTEMVFLATAAKRQRSEVRMSELSHQERSQFIQAKDAEIQNWLKTGTVMRILRHKIPPEEILRCRWILTWKPVDEVTEGPNHKAKARLVVLGYQDPAIETIPRDSPTLGRHSKMLILQLIASKGWTLQSFDIKAAFLQGSVAGRTIGLEPVPELARALSLKPHECCQLNKSAYGLIDAPYLWYQTLLKELQHLGFHQSPFDPCVFILKQPKTQHLAGILGIHVDDGLCGGNEYFNQKIMELSQKYPFGSRKASSFTFTGIELVQTGDKGIRLSQSKYVREIPPIAIDTNRKTTPEEPVTEEERHALRGLIGSLQYAAINTRPDLSSQLSHLQSSVNQATVGTLAQGNKTLHEAKRHHDVSITIHPIPCEDLRFLAFSDASFASKRVPDSHAGMIILTTHRDIAKNISCPVSAISWGCKKIQKVVTSTLSAETMALTTTLDQLSWLRLFWSWLLDDSVKWKQPGESLKMLPPAFASPTAKAQSLPESITATDCKSLYDLVTRTAPPQCAEFRTQLYARSIKDMLSENTTLRWVHSGAQLADALTKVMESSFLRNTLKIGKYRLNDEMEILKQRSNNRNRLKWLKNSCDSTGPCSDQCMLCFEMTNRSPF